MCGCSMTNEHKVVKFDLGDGTTTGDIAKTLDKWCQKGWELVSITPITTGKYDVIIPGSDGGAGWGYGYTSWLMITFSRQSTD